MSYLFLFCAVYIPNYIGVPYSLVIMAAPGVADLFCKAVNEGSLHELKVLTNITDGRQSWQILWTLATTQTSRTCLKVAVESEFYDVLKFLVHQLEISI